MEYLLTHPPVTDSDVFYLIKRIEDGSTPYIDGPVLSALVQSCYHCALKNRELIDLIIGNVVGRTGKVRGPLFSKKRKYP